MQIDTKRLIRLEAIEERTLKSIVKLLLVVGALFLLWGLISNLPGIDGIVPEYLESLVSFRAVRGAVVTLGIVVALGYVAFEVEPLLVEVLSGPAEVVADVASIVKHVILFVAVITAHRGFAPLFVPSLESVDLLWTYDLVFLVLGLVPTVVIAVRMVGNFDEVASIITARLSSSRSTGRTEAAESQSLD